MKSSTDIRTQEHPNATVLRRTYDAYVTKDFDTLKAVFAPNLTWHVSGKSGVSGDYQGIDEVLDYFRRTIADTAETLKVEAQGFLGGDNYGAILLHVTASRQGKKLDDDQMLVGKIRDGRVTEMWQTSTNQQASDEFWS
ncbi:MAG: hypothetical protein DLM53_11045 [Candidatus Eremiobacter antarcticus]|nr:nuclear transport factor 2 family protein [Candidatus Eremiobacteraeota bacterium]PZR60880.1 MAG: hypothetical protein DLM53_11045 [Candidatus Eremiobacter sp. RRmetagenome_bin22]